MIHSCASINRHILNPPVESRYLVSSLYRYFVVALYESDSQTRSNKSSSTFEQYASSFVPLGVKTSILVAVMLLQAAVLEQAMDPISGSYFLLVVPVKLVKRTLRMVSGEGYSLQRVVFFWP